MPITHRILGSPGQDNALFVQIDSGQEVERLLFDCGGGCLQDLSFSEIQSLDHLCFSHQHMDHIAGFDAYFRANFQRDLADRPNRIWGPPGSAAILQHRFQGYLWNLHDQMPDATWLVSELHPQYTRTCRYELGEAFAIAHEAGTQPPGIQGTGFTIETHTMDHKTPTIAYVVHEKPRTNIDTTRLAALGLRPGPWLHQLKQAAASESGEINVHGTTHAIADLRRDLLIETLGDSIAYLTDFRLDDAASDRLTQVLRGCRTLVCEGQYRHADLELARRHHHTTTVQTATLAARAGVEELILFHLSERYSREGWIEMLQEARRIFPNTRCPPHWGLEVM